MKRCFPLFTAGLGLAIVACGSLDAHTGTAPTLATVSGSLSNPQSVPVSGAVRVAVVWRTGTEGQFNVAEDLPVQPVFPSSFTIDFDTPPPAAAMNNGSLLNPSSPPVSEGDAGTPSAGGTIGSDPTADAGAPGTGGPGGDNGTGPVPQDTPISPNFQFAVGTVLAYVDLNGNGKLDLVAPGASSYIDQIVAANQEMAIAYFEGPIPTGTALTDTSGHLPADGYNLISIPYCPIVLNPLNAPNAACTNPPDAGATASTCDGTTKWLPIATPYTLSVATDPRVSSWMCLTNDNSSSISGGSGTGPSDPSVQPPSYPDPCDPNLSCAPDGSSYFYETCTTVSQGICEGTVQSCTSVSYSRPTAVPAGWPCVK